MDKIIVKDKEYVLGGEVIARGQLRDIYEAACKKGFSNSQTGDPNVFRRNNLLARLYRVEGEYRLVRLEQV